MPEEVELMVDGTRVSVAAGTTVAGAVANAGRTAFRHSVSGEPRWPLCGMGICFECRVTIDGRAHSRSCQVMARSGMVVRTT
jgi:predicted molibdopterin-dependent oxidoreductase YjgC